MVHNCLLLIIFIKKSLWDSPIGGSSALRRKSEAVGRWGDNGGHSPLTEI